MSNFIDPYLREALAEILTELLKIARQSEDFEKVALLEERLVELGVHPSHYNSQSGAW